MSDRKNEQVLLSVDKLSRQNEALEAELATLSSTEPPLKTQQREKEQLLADLDKIDRFLNFTESKKQKAAQVAQGLIADISANGKC